MPKRNKGGRASLLPLLGLLLLFLMIIGAVFYLLLTAVAHAPASLPAGQQGNIGKGQNPWASYNPDWWLPKLHCYRPANTLYCTDNSSGN